MSSALQQVVERASTDAAFRVALVSHPDRALSEYKLTAEERLALLRGVLAAQAPHGVERRLNRIDHPCEPDDLNEILSCN